MKINEKPTHIPQRELSGIIQSKGINSYSTNMREQTNSYDLKD